MLNSESLWINIGNHRKSSVNVGNLRVSFGGLRKSPEIFLQFSRCKVKVNIGSPNSIFLGENLFNGDQGHCFFLGEGVGVG